jgi:hypothetical protein
VSLYPSDNDWDVPSLRLDMQATAIVPPVLPWGALARGRPMQGTWHFFTDDSRWSALLRYPPRILESGCSAAVEPNCTTYEQSPRWEVLASIGRKRTVARQWQDMGVRVLVDLNIPLASHDLALLGVPHGWLAYATRGYHARPESLDAEYHLAKEHAGQDPLLLVVGGGRKIQALTRELPGCIYVADFAESRRLAINTQKLRSPGIGGIGE